MTINQTDMITATSRQIKISNWSRRRSRVRISKRSRELSQIQFQNLKTNRSLFSKMIHTRQLKFHRQNHPYQLMYQCKKRKMTIKYTVRTWIKKKELAAQLIWTTTATLWSAASSSADAAEAIAASTKSVIKDTVVTHNAISMRLDSGTGLIRSWMSISIALRNHLAVALPVPSSLTTLPYRMPLSRVRPARIWISARRLFMQ